MCAHDRRRSAKTGSRETPEAVLQRAVDAAQDAYREEFEAKLAAVCKRLSIEYIPWKGYGAERLALVDQLALLFLQEQPEFTGKRGRGRPKIDPASDREATLALFVDVKKYEAEAKGVFLTDREALEILEAEEPGVVPKSDDVLGVLLPMVSRGRRKLSRK
jgi:hypothetical protein